MKEYAIIVGHSLESPGASSPYGIPPEYFFNSKVATYLTDIADIYYYDSYKGGYSAMVNRLAEHINQHKYKVILDLHYNSHSSSSAQGSECLYWHTNSTTKREAARLSKMISSKFHTTDRGAKPRDRSGRGGYLLYKMKNHIITVEPFFGSSESDTKKFRGREQEYANLLKQFLKVY